MKKNIILVVFLTATLGCVAATGGRLSESVELKAHS